MSSDDRTQIREIEGELAGQKFRAKGYRLVDLIWLPMIFGIAYTCLQLYNHEASAKDGAKEIASTLKESNQAIAATLKESQAALAEAMRQVATEQKRANEIGREQTCLLTLPPDRRTNAGDFCKRLSRERDR